MRRFYTGSPFIGKLAEIRLAVIMLIHGNNPRTEKSETAQAARAREYAARAEYLGAASYRDSDFSTALHVVLICEAVHER